MVFHVPLISNLLFVPMMRKADNIYASADEIFAVSQTYADRALQVNSNTLANVVYLGTDREDFDRYANLKLPDNGKIKIAYAGTLGNSYDLKTVILALSIISINQQVELIVMGDGELRESFENLTIKNGVSTHFTGKLAYTQMISCLSQCDIAVNPIKKGSAASIINKVADYAMAGLPVINTQESQEYRDLLERYNAGINCLCENVEAVTKAIQYLLDNPSARKVMAQNSRKMGELEFDRKENYQKIIKEVMDCSLINNNGG